MNTRNSILIFLAIVITACGAPAPAVTTAPVAKETLLPEVTIASPLPQAQGLPVEAGQIASATIAAQTQAATTPTTTPAVPSLTPVPSVSPTAGLIMEVAPMEIPVEDTLLNLEEANIRSDCSGSEWLGGESGYDFTYYRGIVLNARLDGLSVNFEPEVETNPRLVAFDTSENNNVYYAYASASSLMVCILPTGVKYK